VASTGVAAHIFSASEAGPRGQGGLTAEELSQAQNALWVCADHGRLIDANRGDKYPPALLLSYKHLQEARIAREQGGLHAPFRWLHELRLIQTPLTSANQKVLFGKLNLVVGANDTAKTAICEWISAFSTLEWLKRWRHGARARYPIVAELAYFDPEPHVATVTIGCDGSLAFQIDGRDLPLCPLAMRVVFPRSRRDATKTQDLDDLQLVSKLLSLDPAVCRNLAVHVNQDHDSTVQNIHFVAEDGRVGLQADVEGTAKGLSFQGLSGGEQDRILMEFTLALCRAMGGQQATLLILDPCLASLDGTWFERYSSRLSNPRNPFQTIAAIPTLDFDAAKLRWLGWEIIRTEGSPPNVLFDQSAPWPVPNIDEALPNKRMEPTHS
jgi:hypothetical protein